MQTPATHTVPPQQHGSCNNAFDNPHMRIAMWMTPLSWKMKEG
jgi:hypothetical protein